MPGKAYLRRSPLNRVDSAPVRNPEAAHGIAYRPGHLIGRTKHVLAWFERYADEDSGGASNASR